MLLPFTLKKKLTYLQKGRQDLFEKYGDLLLYLENVQL